MIILSSKSVKQQRRNKEVQGEPQEVQEQKREAKDAADRASRARKLSDGIPPA